MNEYFLYHTKKEKCANQRFYSVLKTVLKKLKRIKRINRLCSSVAKRNSGDRISFIIRGGNNLCPSDGKSGNNAS